MEKLIVKYNIDINRLERNYFSNPLKINKNGINNERPTYNDMVYLYCELNITQLDLPKIFNVNLSTTNRWLSDYKIKKDIKKRIKNTIQSNLIKYGVENVFQLEEIKKKSQDTCITRYNVINHAQININKSIYNLLYNKEQLKEYIIKNNISSTLDLSHHFNMGVSALDRYLKKYNLYHLFSYNHSSYEEELSSYISKYYNIILNTRSYLKNSEIDIYIPKLNIGIEINGNYWHSEKIKDKVYHQEKSLMAEANGIFIYHIFEYEWFSKKEQILNQLNNLLGINQEKIYARKCIIKEVSNKEKKQFLELNHLQGNDSSSIKLGLYYEGELVSLMTFCKPRFNKKYEYELSRFCSKAGTNVIGGASKLWKYFIKTHKPTSVISYSNIAHTKGKLYETLGFNLQGVSEPNYVWCKGFKTLSRYQCQKHKLLIQGYQGNTETEIMHSLGYYRIYDCGNKVWVYNML